MTTKDVRTVPWTACFGGALLCEIPPRVAWPRPNSCRPDLRGCHSVPPSPSLDIV